MLLKVATGQILLVTVLFEGGLAVIALLWGRYRSIPLPMEFSSEVFLPIAALLFGLLLVNLVLFGFLPRRVPAFKIFHKFKDKIIYPVALQLNWPVAVVVSLFAGLGEELFFRYALQHEVGWFIANVLFAVLHFGRLSKKYFLVVVVYFLIGCGFSFVYSATGNIVVVVTAHALYDLIALVYMRYFYHSPLTEELENLSWR